MTNHCDVARCTKVHDVYRGVRYHPPGGERGWPTTDAIARALRLWEVADQDNHEEEQ